MPPCVEVVRAPTQAIGYVSIDTKCTARRAAPSFYSSTPVRAAAAFGGYSTNKAPYSADAYPARSSSSGPLRILL